MSTLGSPCGRRSGPNVSPLGQGPLALRAARAHARNTREGRCRVPLPSGVVGESPCHHFGGLLKLTVSLNYPITFLPPFSPAGEALRRRAPRLLIPARLVPQARCARGVGLGEVQPFLFFFRYLRFFPLFPST